jgi:subtilisin family serine protease
VAGIALAATGNGKGIAGVAPGADLLAVRVLSNQCTASGCTASGTSADVSAGIRWAVANGADVINLSLGAGATQSAFGCSFCDAVRDAWTAGVIVVVAAGNDALLPAGFDATIPAVVVTATTRDDTRASYSSTSSTLFRDARWPLAAPGGEAETEASDCGLGGTPKSVLSAYWSNDTAGSDYACLAGTSMAAPHVSGALSVLLSAGYAPEAAIQRLIDTATDLGPAGRDASFGHGRIDLGRAIGPASGSGPGVDGSVGATSATTTTGVAPSTTPAPAPAVTTPAPTVAAGPPVSAPETSAAAPFGAPATPEDTSPSGWLLGTAVAALVASATLTSWGAWRVSQTG